MPCLRLSWFIVHSDIVGFQEQPRRMARSPPSTQSVKYIFVHKNYCKVDSKLHVNYRISSNTLGLIH